jgi:hypothetical protein
MVETVPLLALDLLDPWAAHHHWSVQVALISLHRRDLDWEMGHDL